MVKPFLNIFIIMFESLRYKLTLIFAISLLFTIFALRFNFLIF